jgi:hypothetical protein
MQQLQEQAYSPEARQKLEQFSRERGEWTEADQKRASEQWNWVSAELKRLVAAGADPAGEAAQAWAKTRDDLLAEFTHRDPQVEAGLNQLWQNVWKLPEDQRPMQMTPPSDAELAFQERAMEAYHRRTQQ